MTYDFNLYDHVESGQASIYRLKYVDSDNGQFIFTNDFGFASAGMGWLLVVNQGTVSLNHEHYSTFQNHPARGAFIVGKLSAIRGL